MKFWTSYALLILWMAVIFYLSSEGHDASSARSGVVVHALESIGVSGRPDILTFFARKAAHTFAYFILGILAYNVVRQHTVRTKIKLLASGAIVILYAISDEFHQQFISGRSSELRDVAIDSTAGIIAILVVHFMYKKYLLHKSQL